MSETKVASSAWCLILAAWIFALEYSLYFVTSDFLDKVIKLGMTLVMLAYLQYRRSASLVNEKTVLFLFYVLLFTALIPSIFVGDPVTGISQWMKIALMTVVLPLLLLNGRMVKKECEFLTRVYVATGIIFSIQAIVAFFGVLSNMIDTSAYAEIGRRPDLVETTLGLLGYANAIKTPIEGFRWLRPQGWFLEPSLLGAFLLLPAFIEFGLFLDSRKVKHLFLFIVIFVALFLTVSLAAYLGFIVGVSFLFLSKPLYRQLSRVFGTLSHAYPALIMGAFLGLAVLIITTLNSVADINVAELEADQAILAGVYARDPNGDSGNLFREAATADIYVSTILSNPFGTGFAATLGENEFTSANGILFWGVAGGFPALIALIALFGYIFYAFCHPLLMSNLMLHRCIAASFIGHAVHNVSYGNWLAPYFLVHLFIVCVTARYSRQVRQVSLSGYDSALVTTVPR